MLERLWLFKLKKKFPIKKTRIVCIAGKGNNGGGIISAARHITCFGGKVDLILINSKLSTASKFHFSLIRKNQQIKVIHVNKNNKKIVASIIRKSDVILDGIFGTGTSRAMEEPEHSIISMINDSKSFVISNDVPSGIDADTGKIHNISVNADYVVVLHKPKKWMEKNSNQKFCVVNIGIPPEIDKPYNDGVKNFHRFQFQDEKQPTQTKILG